MIIFLIENVNFFSILIMERDNIRADGSRFENSDSG